MSPIKLRKDLGPVVFLGGMNAMPMMYALELRKQGIKVLYFVDRPAKDTLSRPENHFPDIKYPYPEWIVEAILWTQIFLPLFPKAFASWIEKKIAKQTTQQPQAFILNGFFCSLSPYLSSAAPKIFLSSGSDLDSWADIDRSDVLGKTFSGRSIFKYIPMTISMKIIKKVVRTQFFGASACSTVMYFPKGFNEAGDRVLRRLETNGVKVVPRYDVSFEPLKNENRGEVSHKQKLIIFSGVRFLFKTFPDGNQGYGKGNDIIIRGLAEYYKHNQNMEIHFVEKGEDIDGAKELCRQYGIHQLVIWHKEMRFIDLLKLYREADVCFDQVGEHWIGAIGFYALWLGKPLIANSERAIKAGIWSDEIPILCAKSAEDIKKHLHHLESPEFRKKISKESMDFAERELGPGKAIGNIFTPYEKSS